MCKFADNGCQVGRNVFALNINVVVVVVVVVVDVVVVDFFVGSGGSPVPVVHVTKIVDA